MNKKAHPVTRWKCSICGETYARKLDAQLCYDSHHPTTFDTVEDDDLLPTKRDNYES